MIRKLICIIGMSVLLGYGCQNNQYSNAYVSSKEKAGSFPLFEKGKTVPLCVHEDDFEGVQIALKNLQHDLLQVTGSLYPEASILLPESEYVVIVGTLGKSPCIDELAAEGKIPAEELSGKWEKYLIKIVENPFPGIGSALVIAGSDKRGTIFGIYDLSEKIGVSPWYFWADVPVKQQKSLYVLPGEHTDGEPKVKYRGIFINDEAPALAGWVHENYGSFNHEFYEHVFELILRLKGNYLWPAMWGRAFYDDDTLNPVKADAYGVVIGTSHHEPLMRAHDEWRRYGEGPWNYEQNPINLREFWKEGIRRMGEYESIVAVGMRGDGDEPMTEGTAIALLERIVADQREIIANETGKDVTQTPQSWALYKEVQDYYDKGMRVPEDITLLLCDDNWGNIRKLPKPDDRDRLGGFGIYYHFDYVGGPRNYKWLNTNQIERTWEQMHLAYEYGARQIWIVNVGDIKPMELPISFFLDYAWDPTAVGAEDLLDYYTTWATQQFGKAYNVEIGNILAAYTKYNARRKPEMLSPRTYSIDHYREYETVVNDFNELCRRAENIYQIINPECRDAYFQLVLFPVQACANLNELYYAAALNRRYAEEGRAATNLMADRVEELFARDAELTRQYHEDLAGGKWKHMMSQTHIGYTYWQEPRENNMPDVSRIDLPEEASMGIAVEGKLYDSLSNSYLLPEFDRYADQEYRIEIFNRGQEPFQFSAESEADWVQLSLTSGEIKDRMIISVSVNWKKADPGVQKTKIYVAGAGDDKLVELIADNTPWLDGSVGPVYLESNGAIAIEAANFSKAVASAPVKWVVIPNLGRTASAVTAFPVTGEVQSAGNNSPHLEYPVFIKDTGKVTVTFVLAPTLDFHNSEGRRIAVSIDEEEPITRNIHEGNSGWLWNMWVGTNSISSSTNFTISRPGKHVVKYWLVDPGLVLQRILVHTEPPKRTYLGPPESYFTADK
ncbi:glycosyl hydrolase 115 family protein [Bacteroidota bacterium]